MNYNMFSGYNDTFEYGGETYNLSININKIFQSKLLTFFRRGLKVENLQVPSGVQNVLKLSNTSNNGKYVFYISVPSNNVYLANEFQKWISRFIYYNYSEEEYKSIKSSGMVAVEVRAKTREETWDEDSGELACKTYSGIWSLGEKYGNEELYNLIAKFEKYTEMIKNLDNLSGEEYEKTYEKLESELEELIKNNPELFKDLSEIFGMGDIGDIGGML